MTLPGETGPPSPGFGRDGNVAVVVGIGPGNHRNRPVVLPGVDGAAFAGIGQGRDGRIQNASILFHICMAEFVKNSAALLSLGYHSLFRRGGRCERGVTFEKEDA